MLIAVGHLVDAAFRGCLDDRVSFCARPRTARAPRSATAEREGEPLGEKGTNLQLDLWLNDIPLFTFVPGCQLPSALDEGWHFGPGVQVDPDSEVWSRPGFPPDIGRELRVGVLPWLASVPPEFECDNYTSVFEALDHTLSEFQRAIDCGKIEGPLPYRPHLVMPIGLVTKVQFLDGALKLRIVIDATRTGLNDGVVKLTTTYDELAEALSQMKATHFVAKLDLTDAFWSWAMNPIFANLYGIRHPTNGQYYRWRYLYFGFTQSPMEQQRFVRLIKRAFKREGVVATIVFVDDFYLWASSEAECQRAMDVARATLLSHGLICKATKTEGPARDLEYAGREVNLDRAQIRISAKRADRLSLQARTLEQRLLEGTATADDVHRYACRLNFYGGAVAGGSAEVWPLFEFLRGIPLAARPKPTATLLRSLRFWQGEAYELPGQPLLTAEDGTLFLKEQMALHPGAADCILKMDLCPGGLRWTTSSHERFVELSEDESWLPVALAEVTAQFSSLERGDSLLVETNWPWLVTCINKLHHHRPEVLEALRPLVKAVRRPAAGALAATYQCSAEPARVPAPDRSEAARVERELGAALRLVSAEAWGAAEPSQTLRATVVTDGASRGNPGPAAAAAVVEIGADSSRIETAHPLGEATNNAAEVAALLLGLRTALDLGVRQLVLYTDSDLLVRLLRGKALPQQRVTRDFVAAASRLLTQFVTAEVRHAPREATFGADRLANEVLDMPGGPEPIRREFWGPTSGAGYPGNHFVLGTDVVPGHRVILFPSRLHNELEDVARETEEALTTSPTTEVYLVVPACWGTIKYPALKHFKHQLVDPQLVTDIVGYPCRLLSHLPQPLPACAVRIRSDARWLVAVADG